MTVTTEMLRELFDYEPETGVFRRRIARSNRVKAGDVICSPKPPNGYLYVRIDKRPHYLHRLAWLWVHGAWPVRHIDHVNGDRSDNRIANLREATASQNHMNCKRYKNNISGLKGVHFNKRNKRWVARISVGGSVRSLGAFSDPESAHAAYRKAATEIHGEFARFG